MKIYHYTSIQTLALILKSKKMRFNRLDRVDDIEESAYSSGPNNINLSQYQFVSCWTKSSEENLALWNMYTCYRGVRIGIESIPFKTYKVNEKLESLIPETLKLGQDYFASAFNNPAILHDIKYVENPQDLIKKLVGFTDKGLNYDTLHAGLYKRKEWAIQQEARFKINVFPVDFEQAISKVKLRLENGKLYTRSYNEEVILETLLSLGSSLDSNKTVSLKYIDMPLDESKLNNIEVMLGPLTTEADRIIVESLLQSYPGSSVPDSKFKGKIREKNLY